MSLDLAVLTIGDELLSGELADTNTRTIARILGARGWRIAESRSVPDRIADIAQALITLAGERDAVIVTGGLGPTDDDRTAQATAEAFGLRLVPDEEALEQIKAFFAARQKEMLAANEKQALLPEGAKILPNSRGTAPGFCLQFGETRFYFLPGVPAEMEPMLKDEVLPRMEEAFPAEAPLQERQIRIFGLSEPKVEQLLTSRPLPPGVELGFGVDYPIVIVKLRSTDAALLEKMSANVQRLLAKFVIATGEQSPAAYVGALLRQSGKRLALAESCTGGMIAQLFTAEAGSSDFLVGGAVTYHNKAKECWLGVPKAVLETEGAVSAPCAEAMAKGMLRTSGADLALAVTGIAGPDGGTEEKPVGTVFLSLARKGSPDIQVERFRFYGDRERVRRMSAVTGIDWIRRALLS